MNGTTDHVHVAAAIPPRYALADVVGQIKGRSSHVLNHRLGLNFEWQSGYGAHSFGEKQLPWVMRYIERQKEHHAEQTMVLRLEAREDGNNGPEGLVPE